MTTPANERTVLIQGQPIVVVPQKHARLRRMLSAGDFENLMSGSYGHESYRVLGVLVPDLHAKVPEWQWEGFADRETWDAWTHEGVDPRDEETALREIDQYGPTTDEMVNLFEMAFKVSGAQRLGKLLDLVQVAQRMQGTQSNALGTPTLDLPVSPGESGA